MDERTYLPVGLMSFINAYIRNPNKDLMFPAGVFGLLNSFEKTFVNRTRMIILSAQDRNAHLNPFSESGCLHLIGGIRKENNGRKREREKKTSMGEDKKRRRGCSSPPFLGDVGKSCLFQPNNNSAHKIALLPIFFSSFGMFIMAIGAAIQNGIIG